MQHERRLAALLGLSLLAACARSEPAPAPFTIARTSPALDGAAAPLLLNDAVTVYFSADVLPVSVTPDSVTVVDEDGRGVPGTLRVGANWVSFHPVPPVTADLQDGSYRPGATYRLLVAGSPRPDAVRSADGRWLASAAAFDLRIAGVHDRPDGLPAPLRPPPHELPLLLQTAELSQQLPADEPRLRLHFTQPLLPASVRAQAFEITLFGGALEELVPRHVRVVPSRLDDLHGSTVEIDLGAWPERGRGGPPAPLAAGDLLSVQLRRGEHALRDYAGHEVLPALQMFRVVAGDTVAIAWWPATGEKVLADDALGGGFEVRDGVVRPRVRVEAGDGSLGAFHPRRDTTLRPGEPFDRGDGTLVASAGSEFAFTSIEVPDGVTVRVDGSGTPVHLLATGSVRIAGRVELQGASRPLPRHLVRRQPVRELLGLAPVAILAAGDVVVRGAIVSAAPPADDGTGLLLAAAGAIDLRALTGELPFQTLLAREVDGESGGGGILGVRGQSLVFDAEFTYGVPPGADFEVRGATGWQPVPLDRDGGVVHVVEGGPGLRLGWQTAPADPVRRAEPDLTLGRVSRLQPAGDGAAIALPPGGFVRFVLQARVRAGELPPRLRELRLCDR